jgi:hypothetical protein
VAEPITQLDTDVPTPRKPLTDKDIVCLGHLKRVFPLLDRLHEVGCERDKADNRELHFDDYCKLVLLYTWNPLIDSVRTLQQVVELGSVARAMGVKRFSAGSFSESVRVFEPELLKQVIAELAGEARALPQDPRLADLKDSLTLVDGTILAALPRLARAASQETRYCTTRNGRALYGWRLHTQLDLKTFTPRRIDRTGACSSGAAKEGNVLAATLQAGLCYVMDGGYGDGQLFDRIIDAGSSFVGRIRAVSVFEEVLEERHLSDQALKADIVRDAIVRWSGKHPIRIIELKITPRPRSGGHGADPTDQLVIATNMLDLDVDLAALIYLNRYSVELFFRTLKQLLGLRHLLSQRQEGLDIQVYCAVIVCLLINLITGAKPNKAMVNMVGFHLLGLASEQELLDFLNKPDAKGVKLRAKAEAWKKLGF